jgi:hypothetical protein
MRKANYYGLIRGTLLASPGNAKQVLRFFGEGSSSRTQSTVKTSHPRIESES